MENTQKFIAKAFLAIAALSLIFAIVCFAMETDKMWGTSNVPYETYGGDAYTGIQNAAASTSNNTFNVGENISNLAECITTISGFIFVIIGIMFAALGWYKLKLLNESNQSEIDSQTTDERDSVEENNHY